MGLNRTSYSKLSDSREFIYLSVFFLYAFVQILNSSLLKLSIIPDAVFIGSCSVLAVLFFTQRKFKPQIFTVFVLVMASFLLTALFNGRRSIVIYMLLMINSDNIDFKKILKVSLIATLTATLLVIASSLLGITVNRVYYRGGENANSLGFTYYSAYPFILFFNMLSYMYLKKDTLKWPGIAALGLINYFIYKISTLRLTFYLSIMVLVLYVVMIKFKMFDLNKKSYKQVCAVIYPVVCIATVIIALMYNRSSQFWVSINSALSNRILLSHTAFDRYGVKLFGQNILTNTMVNGKVVTYNYFYVDSGFIYSVLGYGIIFTAVMLFIYSFLFYSSCKSNNKMMFIWVLAVLVFTIINNAWINMTYNCIPLIFFKIMSESLYNKKQKQKQTDI